MGIIQKIKKRWWMIKAIFRTSYKEKKSMIKGYFQRKKYYPKEEKKGDIKNLINCMLCPNMCRFDCPSVQVSKKETHSPAVKARIAYYLEMDLLDKTEENIQPLFEGCVHCSACQIWCPFDFAVGDLLEGVAVDLFREGKLPQKIIKFSERIREHNGLYAQEKYEQSKAILKEMTKGTVYYFPGCVTEGNNPKAIKSIQKIASGANISLVADAEEKWCCGAPSIYCGDLVEAKKLAAHNKKVIEKHDIEMIVCECPECVQMLRLEYKKLGYDLKVPVYHISEWLVELLNKGEITLGTVDKEQLSYDLPISYHDPCVLARKLQIITPPRTLLKTIFQDYYQDIPYSAGLTHCCGYGGLVNIAKPNYAEEMASTRLQEFANEGIKTIVTTCPTCWYSFMKNNENLEFEIIDLLEIIAQNIKEIICD